MTHSNPAQQSTVLPAPADRPESSIVIYDGHCRFCTAQVVRLHRWDTRGRLSYLSLHDVEVARRWPQLTHDMLMQNMYVVTPEEKKIFGADAIRFLSTQLPKMWPLRWLMHIPGTMPLWRWGYRRFANRRYLFGKRQTCDDGSCRIS